MARPAFVGICLSRRVKEQDMVLGAGRSLIPARLLVLVIGLAACSLIVPARAEQPLVEKLVLADTIQPVTADELNRAIVRAGANGAQALLVELNTPGGLLDSTRSMAGAILSSRVPVIVYVSPAGARAGSAGSFFWSRQTLPLWLLEPTQGRRTR